MEAYRGTPIFILYRKLGAHKIKLIKLNRKKLSDLSSMVADARVTLEQLQESLLHRDSKGELGIV